jgi:hypothetical protein
LPAQRCTVCGANWPHTPKKAVRPDYITWRTKRDYKTTCAACLQPTEWSGSEMPMSLKEARHIAGAAEHERRYEAREKKRTKKGELTPEQEGVLAARAEIKRVRGIRKAMKDVASLPEAS